MTVKSVGSIDPALNVATIRKYAPDLIGFQELARRQPAHLRGGTAAISLHSRQRRQRSQRTPVDLLEARPLRPARFGRVLDQRDAGSLLRLVEYRLRARGDLGALSRKSQRRRISAPEHPPRSPQRIGRAPKAVACSCGGSRSAPGDKLPAILTGDFNCDAYQPPQTDIADANYRFLLSSGFVDTLPRGGK